jgi:hypothetical protein
MPAWAWPLMVLVVLYAALLAVIDRIPLVTCATASPLRWSA